MRDPLQVLTNLHLPQSRHDIIERISTGSVELDSMLGGGWVKYGVNEVMGGPTTGKSLITLLTIGAALERKQSVVLIDADGTFDTEWTQNFFSPRNPNFALVQDISAEHALNLINKLAYSQLKPLVVLDSWSQLAFTVESQNDLTALEPNELPRVRGWAWSSFLKNLQLATATLLFTSHAPVQIGHVTPEPAYIRHCDARVEMTTKGRRLITARPIGGKVTRKSPQTHVVYQIPRDNYQG